MGKGEAPFRGAAVIAGVVVRDPEDLEEEGSKSPEVEEERPAENPKPLAGCG
jgi:hypothetical protein